MAVLSKENRESDLARKEKKYLPFLSIFTHTTLAERAKLLELSQGLPDNSIVVEIGSYLGASTCFLALGCQLNYSKVYAIDTWTNISMSEGCRNTFNEFIRNTAPLQQWIIPLQGLSKDVAQSFDGGIDLLFIDGDHSYEGASSDLEMWLPKVKNGGVVVLHDYCWSKGVRRAVREHLAPRQIEGGKLLDNLYWTRIAHDRVQVDCQIYATIAIPTYQRSEYLLAALKSLLAQKSEFKYEILILDNACDDRLKTAVEDISSSSIIPVRYIPVPEIGLHNGRNIAAIQARGKILVYVDDDIIAPEGWLQALCTPFQDPQVGGVGGRTVPQWEVKPPDWIETTIHPSYFSLLDLGDGTREMEAPTSPYGCNMAFRRELVLTLGGFAPDGMGQQFIEWKRGDGETGFVQKVYAEGYKIIYSYEGWLYHCIPAKRVSLSFIRRRAIKSAIGSGYAQVRQFRLSAKSLIWRSLKHGVKTLYSLLKYSLHLRCSLPVRMLDEIAVIHHAIIALYYLRVIFDRDLKDWIYREEYWIERQWSNPSLETIQEEVDTHASV